MWLYTHKNDYTIITRQQHLESIFSQKFEAQICVMHSSFFVLRHSEMKTHFTSHILIKYEIKLDL